ncbi:MAG TPA: hypothetical protein VH331_06355 [Allosphingosinicella sp.]|nr:hypothetical protein [Allosphingosinicella sp.]
MKITFLTMAAVAALSVAAPAAAQSWYGNQSQSAGLQMQIDDGVRSGAISPADMPALRDGLHQLIALEHRFSSGGISRREAAILDQRGTELSQQIDLAEQSGGYRVAGGDSRAAWEARYDRDHRAAWEARYVSERSAQYDGGFSRDQNSGSNDRFDRPNRGDRFAGDVRVGQRFSSRMGAMPAEYRVDYQDNDQVYYGYDNQRIYRVDRRTGLILGLLDLTN